MYITQFAPSPPTKRTPKGVLFSLADQKRFERERPREGRTRPPPVADKGSVRSEQIRSFVSVHSTRAGRLYLRGATPQSGWILPCFHHPWVSFFRWRIRKDLNATAAERNIARSAKRRRRLQLAWSIGQISPFPLTNTTWYFHS